MMMRIFLRLYLLVLLPFTLVYFMPQYPILYFGRHLLEQQYDQEFSSAYELVKYELRGVPEQAWQVKVESLQPHFPFGLELKKFEDWKFKENNASRLKSQGFILKRRKDFALYYRVNQTPWVLRVGMSDKNAEFLYVEKQTRGIRYLVDKITLQSEDPIKKFNEIKHFFKVPVKIVKASELKVDDKIRAGLKAQNMYYNKNINDPVYMYFSSENKQYVVVAGPLTNSKKIEQYYNYAQIIFPAILIAIGAFIWLFTLLRELKILNRAARQFGQGKLSSRSKLSRFATLYSQSSAFNSMADQVQTLVHGHRDLTNAVSHELKTPLARLRFALQMQQQSQNQADQEKYTHKIEDNIGELEGLINELLNYARLDRSQSLLNLNTHHFSHWLSAEVKLTQEYQPDLAIHLQLDNSADQTVNFDQSLMDKVINNLLSNAIRHANQQIKVSAWLDKNNAYITVEDDGDGVEKDFLDQLFQPFSRMDKSRQRSTGGSGMGLALSKKIIELHHGSIKYQTSTLGGAAFLLSIPRHSASC